MKKYIEPSIKISEVIIESYMQTGSIEVGGTSKNNEMFSSGHRGGDFWSGVWSDGEE